MADTVTIPKVGPVNKKVLIATGIAAGGFVVWRYISARRAASAAPDATDAGISTGAAELPSVAGAVNSDGTISGTPAGSSGTTNPSGSPTTDAEWTDLVMTKLPLDKWTQTDIITALGNWLSGRSLSQLQQDIVRAAKAAAGNPPSGDHPIISGGDVPITVAPSGVTAANITASGADVKFTGVSGAAGYVVQVSGGISEKVQVDTSPAHLALPPGTKVTVTVAAVTGSGGTGPASAAITITTPAGTLPRPAAPHATVSGSKVTLSVPAVPGATLYEWVVNGADHAHTSTPSYVYQGKPKTTYRFSVYVTAGQAHSLTSTQTTVTTK